MDSTIAHARTGQSSTVCCARISTLFVSSVRLVVAAGLLLKVFFSFGYASAEAPAAAGSLDVGARFHATGWMGDGASPARYVRLNEADPKDPHSAPTAITVEYRPGPSEWAGIYWQNRPSNWGDEAGEKLSGSGYKRVSFWARGHRGGELIEFKIGGIKGKSFQDSFERSLGKVVLTKGWTQYTIDLTGLDLSSVIGGFCWVASKTGNIRGVKFSLDDITWE